MGFNSVFKGLMCDISANYASWRKMLLYAFFFKYTRVKSAVWKKNTQNRKKKLRKRGSVLDKKKTRNLTILVLKWKQSPENIYALSVLKMRFKILGHCRSTIYNEFPHNHRVRVFRIEDNLQILAS